LTLIRHCHYAIIAIIVLIIITHYARHYYAITPLRWLIRHYIII
jgi:hypothetical protein